jgi:hypothetical protein
MTSDKKAEERALLDRLVAVSGRPADRGRYSGGALGDLKDMVETAERHAAEMDRLFAGYSGAEPGER